MPMNISRPMGSVAVLAGACLLCLAGTNCSRQLAEPPYTLTRVGANVWAAIDNPRATNPAGANAGFVIGDEAVAVVDTFWSTEAAAMLLRDIRRLTTLPVRYVVNTHYHIDHVAGNGIFVAAGAVVLAQRDVRGWIHSENRRLLGAQITPELEALTAAIAAPTVVYEDGAELYLGSRGVQMRTLPGHTGGDSIVSIPDAGVVFAGDLLWRHMLPNMIDASIDPWIETLNTLAAGGSGRTFVPGHGSVADARDVTAFRDYLTVL